jgi:hypothetical protein
MKVDGSYSCSSTIVNRTFLDLHYITAPLSAVFVQLLVSAMPDFRLTSRLLCVGQSLCSKLAYMHTDLWARVTRFNETAIKHGYSQTRQISKENMPKQAPSRLPWTCNRWVSSQVRCLFELKFEVALGTTSIPRPSMTGTYHVVSN